MFKGFFTRRRAQKDAQVDAEYGHATRHERHELGELRDPPLLNTEGIEHEADREFNRAEGRPSRDY
jgi:hypothetical protein